MPRQINAAGLELVKSFEGLRLDAYRDTGGVLTIGYGHTKGVKGGDRITEQVASGLLMDDLEDAEAAVAKFITVPLNDNQFAALVSFAFNCGTEAFRRSTLRKKLNARDYDAVPGQLALWVNDNGKKLAGLVRRRKAEADLWNTPFIINPAHQQIPTPAPQKPPVDAAKTAGYPPQATTPKPSNSKGSSAETGDLGTTPSGKTVAAGAAGVLVFAAAFWTWALDGWHHLVSIIERIF